MRIVDFSNVMARWSAESLIQIKWKLKKKNKKKIRNPLTVFDLFSVRTNRLHIKNITSASMQFILTNLNVTGCSTGVGEFN